MLNRTVVLNTNKTNVKYTLYTENNTITKWETVKQCISAHLSLRVIEFLPVIKYPKENEKRM